MSTNRAVFFNVDLLNVQKLDRIALLLTNLPALTPAACKIHLFKKKKTFICDTILPKNIISKYFKVFSFLTLTGLSKIL